VVEGVFADEALACGLLRQQKQSRADGAHQGYCGHRLGKEQLACRRIHGHVFDAALGFAFDLPEQIEMRDPAEISLDVADEQVVLGHHGAGHRVDGGQAVFSPQARGVLDRPLRHVCKLGMTTPAAIFGTGAMSPILAAGRSARAWEESLVTVGFMTVGLAIVASSIIVLWGLRRAA